MKTQTHSKGTSLRNLVEKYGFGIQVASLDPEDFPFVVLSENNTKTHYKVQYKNGLKIEVLKEHKDCNDYYLLKKAD